MLAPTGTFGTLVPRDEVPGARCHPTGVAPWHLAPDTVPAAPGTIWHHGHHNPLFRVCPECGNDYLWPGLLDHHQRLGACRPDIEADAA